jgi:Calx-beta domain
MCTLLLGALVLAVSTSTAQAAVVVDDVQVTESGGAVNATFTITRTAGLLAPATSIAYQTIDGTATAPADYRATGGTRGFGAALLGATQTQQVSVVVEGDGLDEADETFGLVISGPEVADDIGTATIVDDDPAPVVGVGDAPAAAEGGSAVFTIALSAPSGRAVSVAFTTVDGSAVAGQDYTARSAKVGIPAGATSATVGVALLDDSAAEPAESFGLRLSAPSAATLGAANGGATILDNDQPGGAAPKTPPATSGQPPATGGSGTPTGALPQLGVSSPRLRRPSTILVTVSCPHQAGACNGQVTVFTRPNRRSRIKALRTERRLGRRKFTLPAGGTQTLLIALSRKDRVLLRRAGRMDVRAYAVTQDGAGRSGVRRVNGTLIGRTTHSG